MPLVAFSQVVEVSTSPKEVQAAAEEARRAVQWAGARTVVACLHGGCNLTALQPVGW